MRTLLTRIIMVILHWSHLSLARLGGRGRGTLADDITYRWIDGPDSGGSMPATAEEWAAIDTVLVKQGWMALNRILTRVLIAEDSDGAMVGFSIIQLLPNCGPFYVEKS